MKETFNNFVDKHYAHSSESYRNDLKDAFAEYMDNREPESPMDLSKKIDIEELMEFVAVFNHEYAGKKWSIHNFRTALNNWMKPKSHAPENQDAEEWLKKWKAKQTVYGSTADGSLLLHEKMIVELLEEYSQSKL